MNEANYFSSVIYLINLLHMHNSWDTSVIRHFSINGNQYSSNDCSLYFLLYYSKAGELEKRGHINIALNVRRYAYMKTCAWYSFLYLKIITQIPFFFCPILCCLLLSFTVLWCLLPRWADFFVFLWKPILQLSHEPDISW